MSALLAKSLSLPAVGIGGGLGSILGVCPKSISMKSQWDTIPNNVFKLITINFINKWERIDLETVRGDRLFPYQFLIQIDGAPFDLTKRNIQFAYRKQGSGATKVINGQPLPTAGQVVFLAGNDDFNEAGTFEWDLQVYRITGRPQTFAKGLLNIADDINKL